MSIWNEHKPSGNGGTYLKLKDGDGVTVRFYSPPAVVTYDGQKLRYQVVLYNKIARQAQIFEFGPQIFGQLADLYENWGEPGDMDLTIKRKGSGQFDTEYSVLPLPKSVDLTKEQTDECDAIPFPGSKAKWLVEYEHDHVMPETIEGKAQPAKEPDDIVVEDIGDEPINLDDIPFGNIKNAKP